MDKNIAALVRDDANTVGVKFFSDRMAGEIGQVYSSKVYKYATTLDLVPGDMVIVLVAGVKPTCAVVVEVHQTVDIEPNSELLINWIVAKFDLAPHDKLMEENRLIEETLRIAYTKNARRQFRDIMLASVDEDTRSKLLAITEKRKD